jgi:DNA-binding NarL/FixJ family response regulator
MRLALEPDFTVVGEAADGWEALQEARELQPDVVVTGIHPPYLDGIALTGRLRRDFPDCAVIVLTLYDDAITRRHAEEAGAAVFISLQDPDEMLMSAIRAAALGQ